MRLSRLGLAAALVLFAACTQEAAPVPETGSLVVTDDSGAVWRLDPATGEGDVVWEGPGDVVQATPSPDGQALVWTDTGGDGPSVAVHRDGATTTIAAPTAPFFYAWSPEANQLVALGNDEEGEGVALVVVDVAERTARQLDVDTPYFVGWSPDGERLAAHVGSSSLVTVTPAGTRTAVPVTPGRFMAPVWAPDGRVLAVVSEERATVSADPVAQTSTSFLAYVDPDSGDTEPLLEVTDAVSFDLAPDGSRVAVVDGVGGAGTALGTLLVVGEGDPVAVADDVVAFEWSPGGSHLLYHTLDPGAGLVPHVWDGEASTQYPGFVPTDLFVGQYLPFWAQYVVSVTQWAPNSSAFAYAAAGDGAEPDSVYVQPLDGEPRLIADGAMVVWSP